VSTSSGSVVARPRPSGSIALLIATLAVAAVPRAVVGADTPGIAPGSVIRWQASDTVTCSLGESTWQPIGDTCWYAIDLGTEPGPLVIGRIRGGTPELATVQVDPYPYSEERITVDERMAHPPEDQLERIRREQKRVAALLTREGTARYSLPLAPPLDPLPRARSFGARRIINGDRRTPHSGVDLSAAPGTDVYAAAQGTVILASELYFAGNAVFIDHGDQLFTMYLHLSAIAVGEGEHVDRGQVVGKVGASGRATGPHLHFGVRWHDSRVNPLMLISSLDDIPSIGSALSPAP
jgi:hypothetical protein